VLRYVVLDRNSPTENASNYLPFPSKIMGGGEKAPVLLGKNSLLGYYFCFALSCFAAFILHKLVTSNIKD
jgi:hypothetical protein